MNRMTKQILYGSFYAMLWLIIFYGGYRISLKPAPSCTDNIQNRDEQEADCGGVYCIPCEIKKLQLIQIPSVRLFQSADSDHVNAMVEIRNPNVTYGAQTFGFDLAIRSAAGPVYQEHVVIPVYPSELKYRLFINLPIAYSESLRGEATTTELVWAPLSDLPKPRTPTREVHLSVDAVGKRAIITGIVQNDNAFVLHKVTLNGVLSDKANEIIGVSKTVVQDLTPKEERFFQIVIPIATLPAGPETLNPRIFIEAER